MKKRLDEKSVANIKKTLRWHVERMREYCDDEILMGYDRCFNSYVKEIYKDTDKRDIDKYLLKFIIEVTQSELSGDTEYFLIRKYGIDKYLRIKVDELGYPEE